MGSNLITIIYKDILEQIFTPINKFTWACMNVKRSRKYQGVRYNIKKLLYIDSNIKALKLILRSRFKNYINGLSWNLNINFKKSLQTGILYQGDRESDIPNEDCMFSWTITLIFKFIYI